MKRGEVLVFDTQRKKRKPRYWFFDAVDEVYGDFSTGIRAQRGGKEWSVDIFKSEDKGAGAVIPEPTVSGHRLPNMHYVTLERVDEAMSKATKTTVRVYSKGFAPLQQLPHWSKPWLRGGKKSEDVR